jgi:N-acetylmuramoyl-L-alanine amidase
MIRFFLFLFIFISLSAAAIPARALTVNELRVGEHPTKTRMVLELSQSVPFRIFTLSSPYRLVIDLPAFEWRAGKGFLGGGVASARHGTLKNDISRIVLDLKKPMIVSSAFLLPRGSGQSDRLVLDLTPVSAAEFSKNLDKIHGNLGGKNNTAPPPPPKQSPLQQTFLIPPPDEPESKPTPQIKTNDKKPLVIIDPGHGGADSGAISVNGIMEKTITLALGRQLRDKLLESGNYRVKMTRDKDVFIPLRERVNFARRNKGDLFISIHADSINKSGVKGASVYTLSEKASDEETEKLAARENMADAIGGIDIEIDDQEIANILVDLAMRDTMNQSKFFANKIVRIFPAQGLRLLERPVRSAGFAVLKAPDIPSVLVETGYLSNRSEAELLSRREHRDKIADALRNGIDAYFDQVRKSDRM